MLKKSNKHKIGVFDSGLGGLSILNNFLDILPGYHYIYLGDTARLPYGEKSPETIYEYSQEGVEFLFSKGCNLVIIACNTASAQALRKLQQEYLVKRHPEKRILGVIRPLVEEFAKEKINTIGVLGTKSTIKSEAYQHEIKKINPNIEIVSQSAPLLVPLIEEGYIKKPATKMILKKYLRPLKAKKVQALILACTHYPFLLKPIQAIMGKNVNIPHPGVIVAKSLKKYLAKHPELNIRPGEKTIVNYYTSDDTLNFQKEGEKFLQKKIENIKKVKID